MKGRVVKNRLVKGSVTKANIADTDVTNANVTNGRAVTTPVEASSRVYVNIGGTIGDARRATVSAMDHGFLYGDSVYETVRTVGGIPFLLGRHLDRLQRSLDRVFLSLPLGREELEQEIRRTLREVPLEGDVALRVVVSRGIGPIGLDVACCEPPRYLIYVFELSADVVLPEASTESDGRGVSVVISKTRRNSPLALDPAIKSGNFLNNIFAYKEACDAGAHEALFCNADGYVAEGTTANVFVVKDDFVWTPHAYGILDGITRGVVFEEAEQAGIALGETNIPPEALFAAEEIFLTSSLKGVLPVTEVNGSRVGDGKRGPLTLRLQELYERRMRDECGTSAEPATGSGQQPRMGRQASS